LLVVVNSSGKGRDAARRDVWTEDARPRERDECIFRDRTGGRFKDP
jgi:hypothetical protein